MADHGTITTDTRPSAVQISGYDVVNRPPSTPTPAPTTGQIWPRGNR